MTSRQLFFRILIGFAIVVVIFYAILLVLVFAAE
jgi:hypothetical protein